jgi:ubiquitin-like 1-activating enzyme E1 B
LKFGESHVISASGDSDHPPLATGVMRDQKVWDIEECTKVFEDSLASLKERSAKLAEDDHLVWDKDDKDSMDFVAACANIRAAIFSIPTKSRFEIKSMAENIIPAIATTNAITAGIVVLHAFKVLQGKFDKCQSVYMRLRPNARNQLFVPDKSKYLTVISYKSGTGWNFCIEILPCK